MDVDAKLRPIYLINILKERTDEDHSLTTNQLCSILKNEYGIETHRTTIKGDTEVLQQVGIGINAGRSTQNQYNFTGRDFDVAELKLLIDAVQSAKFMTKSKSDQLVSKLTALAGANKARELKRNLVVDGRYKTENEQIIEIIDEEIVFHTIGFDINKYINAMFRMYNAPRREVELVCDNSVMDAIIDQFGPDVETYACDQQNFRVIAEMAVGIVFFNWIFGFGGLVKIKAPEDAEQQYKEQVLKAAENV